MIASARTYFLNNWWTMTFPGLALFVTVISLNLPGDAINDLVVCAGGSCRPADDELHSAHRAGACRVLGA